jgi:predicted TIM-barrel fold metal-dependent hydrolase
VPLQDHHQIVSVDDHLIEHPRVWQDRLPARFKDAAPKIVEVNNAHQWSYDGQLFPSIGLNAVAGKPKEEYGVDPLRYEDMIPGCYDPAARIADMDLDGVQAALCFPSFPGFGGGVFHRASDKELALECIKAWNDFYVQEWCGAGPDRFVPLAMLPYWDIDLAVAEAKRTIANGARTFTFPDAPTALGLPSFHTRYWDPLFDVAQEAGTPLSLHFGSGSYVPGFSYSSRAPHDESMPPFIVAITLFATNLMWTTVDLLFSGTLQRFPGLQFSLSEGGIGWIPYILERADYAWDRHRWYQDIDKDSRPTDLFRRHFWGCFIDDEFGVDNRHAIGVDRITLEVDYPHSDSNWPNTRKRIAEELADVPDDEVEMITETNARRMLNFPRAQA